MDTLRSVSELGVSTEPEAEVGLLVIWLNFSVSPSAKGYIYLRIL